MSAEPVPAAGPLPFGLDATEFGLLGDMLAPLSASFGIDMREFLRGLGSGLRVADAMGLPPGLVEALYGRAHTMFAAGRRDRAETLFRVLCILDARVADHWVGYGVCLQGRGAEAEATLAYASAAATRPDWAVPHFHAAQIALAGEQWTTAAAHLSAFAERVTPALPNAMVQEARRQAAALRFRADADRSKAAGRR